MKTAQDFILEIPVLKPGDQITKGTADPER